MFPQRFLFCLTLLCYFAFVNTQAQYSHLWKEYSTLGGDSVYYRFSFLSPNGTILGSAARIINNQPGIPKVLQSSNFMQDTDTSLFLGVEPQSKWLTDSRGAIWVGDHSSRLQVSTDGGMSWRVQTDFPKRIGIQGGGLESIALTRSGILYAHHNLGALFRSTDKGKTWDWLYSPGGAYDLDGGLEVTANGDIYLLTSLGGGIGNSYLHRSTDNGVNWQRMDTLLPFKRSYSTYADERVDLELVGDVPYMTLHYEEYHTDPWDKDIEYFRMLKPRANGKGMDSAAIENLLFRHAFVANDGTWHGLVSDHRNPPYIRPGLERIHDGYGISTNQGMDWKILTSTNDKYMPPHDTINPATGDTIQTVNGLAYYRFFQVMPNGHILWKSNDWGYNVSTFRIPTPPMVMGVEHSCGTYTLTFLSDSLLGIRIEAEPLFRIQATFDTLRKGISYRVNVVSKDPDTTVHFTIYAKGSMGETVFRDSIPKLYKPTWRISKDTLYVNGGDRAVYRWYHNDTIVPYYYQSFIKMKTKGDYWCDVFDNNSCVHNRVAFTQFTATDVEEDNALVSDKIQLQQNFPNPFGNKCIIRYTLGASQYIQLRVSDALGNVIQTLVEGYQNTGIYEANFDASLLPAGVYYYHLHTADGVLSHKMLIVH